MSDDRKPNIEELYAVAISSGTGFERLVLAAGLQREVVGVSFLRLRAEYDYVRGNLERAGQIAPSSVERACDLRYEAKRLQALAERRSGNSSPAVAYTAEELHEQSARALREAEAIQRRTPAEVMSARAFILVGLTTLQGARQHLGALAVRMGTNQKRSMPPADALRLAGRVLDVWLDETCHKCDGTGVIGNRYQGDHERQCPACKGTGHRRDITGANQAERLFAADLFAEVQRQVGAASAGIKAAIFGQSEARAVHPELARRLAELRGVEAAAD